MTNEASLQDAAARVAEARSVMLTTHVSPDGDGIGADFCRQSLFQSIGIRGIVV